MTSSADYVEEVHQICFIADRLLFSNKDGLVWGSAQCGRCE